PSGEVGASIGRAITFFLGGYDTPMLCYLHRWMPLLCSVVVASVTFAAEPTTKPTGAGWIKYGHNPVLGGKLGTCFDVSVLKDDHTYCMWFSWRPRKSVALVESQDGFHWSDPPLIVLGPTNGGW